MKLVKISVFALGAALILSGCNEEPNNNLLDAPVPIIPSESAGWQIEDSSVVFAWYPVEGAELYALEIARDEEMTDYSFTKRDIEDTTCLVGLEYFDTGQIYYWRVAGSDGSEWGEWSDPELAFANPVLISPNEGEVFSTEPPTFVWCSNLIDGEYIIRISRDNRTVLQDTLSDTTYTVSDEDFKVFYYGEYEWNVAYSSTMSWSQPRSFEVEKSIDLSGTYFPYGLGFEWTYETYSFSCYKYDISESYDTFNVQVVDSFSTPEYLVFQLEYSSGSIDTVKIFGDSISIGLTFVYPSNDTFINVFNPEPNHYYTGSMTCGYYYRADTLHFYHDENWSDGYWKLDEYRLQGIGLVKNNKGQGEGWMGGDQYYEEERSINTLLFFYNGQDTVYKAEE